MTVRGDDKLAAGRGPTVVASTRRGRVPAGCYRSATARGGLAGTLMEPTTGLTKGASCALPIQTVVKIQALVRSSLHLTRLTLVENSP